MATQFTISAVNWANIPSGGETWTFQYKLFSQPDSAYVTISSSAAIAINGNLAVPLTVTGLTPGTVYVVRAYNNCGSPPPIFIQQIQT